MKDFPPPAVKFSATGRVIYYSVFLLCFCYMQKSLVVCNVCLLFPWNSQIILSTIRVQKYSGGMLFKDYRHKHKKKESRMSVLVDDNFCYIVCTFESLQAVCSQCMKKKKNYHPSLRFCVKN